MPSHHQEHSVPHATVPDPRGSAHGTGIPPSGQAGARRIGQDFHIRATTPPTSAPGYIQDRSAHTTPDTRRLSGVGSSANYVLWRHAPVGSMPTINQLVRPATTSYAGRRGHTQSRGDHSYQTRQECTALQPVTEAAHGKIPGAGAVSLDGFGRSRASSTYPLLNGPDANVQRPESGDVGICGRGMGPLRCTIYTVCGRRPRTQPLLQAPAKRRLKTLGAGDLVLSGPMYKGNPQKTSQKDWLMCFHPCKITSSSSDIFIAYIQIHVLQSQNWADQPSEIYWSFTFL